jgi:hypothetical protein
MVGRLGVTWVLAAVALWLFGCARVHEPPLETNAASPTGVQQITLHVPGMIDRQGIT